MNGTLTRNEHTDALAVVRERLCSEPWRKIEEIEALLERLPQQPLPLNHVFVDGLYCREVLMKAGLIVTTRIHLTEHVFVISAGKVSVLGDDQQWVTLRAPHTGVTKPGTRRMIVVHEDCIWSTFHPNPKNETDPDAIVRDVTFTEGKFANLGIAAKDAGVPQLAEGVA